MSLRPIGLAAGSLLLALALVACALRGLDEARDVVAAFGEAGGDVQEALMLFQERAEMLRGSVAALGPLSPAPVEGQGGEAPAVAVEHPVESMWSWPLATLRQVAQDRLRLFETAAVDGRSSSWGWLRAVQPAVQSAIDGPPTLGPVVLMIAVQVCLVSTFAYFYQRHVPGRVPEESEPKFQTGFEHGLFEFDQCCGRDQGICASGFCCPAVRWADTLSRDKVKLLGFWSALFLMLVGVNLDLLATGVFGHPVGGTGIFIVLVAVYYRQQLRKAFGLERLTPGTLVTDCLTWTCCFGCAIVQEARQVQYVRMKREGQTAGSSDYIG